MAEAGIQSGQVGSKPALKALRLSPKSETTKGTYTR